MVKPRLLICIDWFEPAFRAGGPIRSVANLVQALAGDLDIWILTSNSDRGTTAPLDVETDTWLSYRGIARVQYLSPRMQNRRQFRQILNEVHPDCLYCNSMFSEHFTRIPLQESRRYPEIRRVLAVRGMLKAEAMASKRWKKLPYLSLFRLMRLHENLIFHATSHEEAAEIRTCFGNHAEVMVLQNVPSLAGEIMEGHDKLPGELRLISISRILPHKNVLKMIQLLGEYGKPVVFDIYGPIEHPQYWTRCLEAISSLPEPVKVRYAGEISPDKVVQTISKYHALFSLSESENFGHTIIESLQAGRPVIIGNRTPWKGLEAEKAGFDIPLDQTDQILRALEQVRLMDAETYAEWVASARIYGRRHVLSRETIGNYLGMFSPRMEKRS